MALKAVGNLSCDRRQLDAGWCSVSRLTGPRGPLGSELASVAAAQPAPILTAGDLGRPFGRSAEWIAARTGIATLRRTQSSAEIVDLSIQSACAALQSAGLVASNVDVVVTVSCSISAPDARGIAHAISPAAAALHINIACSGFATA
jgi:3-oxoacyl-[acyl-carrier-protein] synthase III